MTVRGVLGYPLLSFATPFFRSTHARSVESIRLTMASVPPLESLQRPPAELNQPSADSVYTQLRSLADPTVTDRFAPTLIVWLAVWREMMNSPPFHSCHSAHVA